MKNQILLYSVFLIVATLFLPACADKHEPEPYTDPKEKMWWGYFEGTFDGTIDEDDMEVSFKNNRDNQRTNSTTYHRVIPGAHFRNYIINTSISYFGDSKSEYASFNLTLSGLYPEEKAVAKSYWTHDEDGQLYTTISLYRKYAAYPTPVEYVPSKEKPFRIWIKDVNWLGGSSFPAIEAQLDGTLYNKDNPQESINVHLVYGSR